MHASLFARYWRLLAAVVTVPILAATAIEGWFVYRSQYDAAIERQMLTARQAAFLVEGYLRPPIERLALIARIPWDYPTASDQEFLLESRRLIRQYPLIERVQRVDAEGRSLLHFSQEGSPRTLGRTELSQMSGVAANGRPAAVRAIERELPGAWSVAVAETGTGRIIVADLRAETVGDVVLRLNDPGGGLVFLVDPSGTVLAHPDISLVHGRRRLQSLAGWSATPAGAALQGDTPAEGSLGELSVAVSTDPSSGKEWFGAYRRVEPVGWTVIALAPSEIWHREIRQAVLRSTLVLVTANAVALLIAIGMARHMSRPLQSLAAASRRVAAGDLAARADVMSTDDVGNVARQFNAMVTELQQSYGELERRVSEKTSELEKANRHKSEFLAQMSHELRTPLNAIIGFSDALKAKYFGPLNSKQDEYVDDIRRSGHHLLALINDLLDLSKIEAGRMELSIAPIDVRALVDASLGFVKQRAENKGVALASHVDPAAAACLGDARRVKQVLVNLLANAVKFTPSGGAVSLDVTRIAVGEGSTAGHAASVRFAVVDTGVGIPEDQLSKLFTDFGQIHSAADAALEGTGLGLALSQRIVDLHGGRIAVSSEVGRGSTFWFTLPEAA